MNKDGLYHETFPFNGEIGYGTVYQTGDGEILLSFCPGRSSSSHHMTVDECKALRDRLNEVLAVIDKVGLVEGVNGKMISRTEDHFLNPDSLKFDPDADAHDPNRER